MTFDPKKYAADAGFDPKAYAAAEAARGAEPKTGAGMAALESFGNAVTLGYLPHIQAAVEQIIPDPNAALDADLRAKGINIEGAGHDYVESRDANLKRQALQREEHPYASAAGTVGGILSGGALIGAAGLGVRGATTAAKIGSAARTGAILGAAQNPGDIEGEINPVQLDARAINSGIGALTGAAVQGAVEVAPTLSQRVSQFLRDKAEKRAFKALGPDLRAVRQNHSKERINDIGRTLLDEGVLDSPTSYGGIANRVEKASGVKGQQIDEILSGLDDEVSAMNRQQPGVVPAGVRAPQPSAGIDRKAIAKAMRDELLKGVKDQDIPGSTAKNAKMGALIDEFESGGDDLLGLLETELKKRKVGKEINWNRLPGADIPDEERVLRSLYTKLKSGVEDAAEAVEGASGKTAFKDAKRNYGNLEEAANIATNKEQREIANRFLSPSDYWAGGVGAVIGGTRGETVEDRLKNVALGASVGLGNKVLRTQGNQVLAKGLDKASRGAELPQKVLEMIQANPVAKKIMERTTPAIANKIKGGAQFIKGSEHPILSNPKIMQAFEQDPSLIDAIQDGRLRAELKEKLRSPSRDKK
jgi:hypothetical protein